ncbi:MAG TPA: hypothetical protein VHN12_08975 [Geobacteraceae bacterium]|nr:hypothetical protein [Geobacteraceae bacterium]
MNMRKLSAGDNVEARCTRCRSVLNHTIVAMVGERVVRVECNTCRGVHNYIREKTAVAPAPRTSSRKSAPVSGKAKKEPGRAEREEWESLYAAMEGKPVQGYDMNGKYRVNDLVEHTVFGLGIVQFVVGPNKMNVLFQSGKKLLRCQ